MKRRRKDEPNQRPLSRFKNLVTSTEAPAKMSLEPMESWPWEQQWKAILAFTIGPLWVPKVTGARHKGNRVILTVPDKPARLALKPFLPSLGDAFSRVRKRSLFVVIEP